jgi:DNA-binding NtrC family response regulator
VDDDSEVRLFLSRVLTSAGYDVEEASDGHGALTAVAGRLPDVVLTDILMPGTDGLELILELRRLSPRAAIIAMSGGSTVGRALHLSSATEFGAAHVLEKPFSTHALLAAVGDALRISARSDEPDAARHVPATPPTPRPTTTYPSPRNQRLGR